MAETTKVKVGFVSGGAGSMPHYNSFLPLLPAEVKLEFEGLELYSDSFYQIAGKKETIVRKVSEFVTNRQWDGVIVTAAPTEVLNPGLFDSLQAALAVPFTTALHACVAALRVYGAERVLLLTPFNERLNELIREHLAQRGVSAVAPHPFSELGVPKRMSPDEVFDLTRETLRAVGKVDAIYFQGAVLDPIKVLERIEQELQLTVVASNPAMFWYLLSKLQLAYSVEGYGRLMREWPRLS
jgi:maleate cis-trans isomerase